MGTSKYKDNFLPPNCTSVIQPLDQGIIKVLKSLYRRDVCRFVLQRLDNLSVNASAKSISKNVSLLDALVFLKNSSKSISEDCVRNCWRHARLLLSEHENVQEFEIENLPFEPEQFQTWASTYPDEEMCLSTSYRRGYC
jgi:DDE superfamily endonuclease